MNEKSTLEYHHIIPRTDAQCTNDNLNIAVICGNCHSLHHANRLNIIGVFPSTAGFTLIYEKDGVCNAPNLKNIKYYNPQPKAMKLYTKKDVK